MNVSNMTYKEFIKWCNERACDGRWSASIAMCCIGIMRDINSIKVKGIFSKKKTEKAREDRWRELVNNSD